MFIKVEIKRLKKFLEKDKEISDDALRFPVFAFNVPVTSISLVDDKVKSIATFVLAESVSILFLDMIPEETELRCSFLLIILQFVHYLKQRLYEHCHQPPINQYLAGVKCLLLCAQQKHHHCQMTQSLR